MIVIEDVIKNDIKCKKVYSDIGKVCYDIHNLDKEFNSLLIREEFLSEYNEKDFYSE